MELEPEIDRLVAAVEEKAELDDGRRRQSLRSVSIGSSSVARRAGT